MASLRFGFVQLFATFSQSTLKCLLSFKASMIANFEIGSIKISHYVKEDRETVSR